MITVSQHFKKDIQKRINGGKDMTNLDYVIKTTKHKDEEILIMLKCPTQFGLKELKCEDATSCEECWMLKVKESKLREENEL